MEDERDDYESDLGRAQEQLQQTQDNLMKAKSRVAAQDNVRAMPQSEQEKAFMNAALKADPMNYAGIEKAKNLSSLYNNLSSTSKGFIDRWDEKMQDPKVFWKNQLEYESSRDTDQVQEDIALMKDFLKGIEKNYPDPSKKEQAIESVIAALNPDRKITIMRTMMHELPYQQRRRYQEYAKKEALVSTDALKEYMRTSEWSESKKGLGAQVPSFNDLSGYSRINVRMKRLGEVNALKALQDKFDVYNRNKTEENQVTPYMVMAVTEAQSIDASDRYDDERTRMRDKVADAIKEIPGLQKVVSEITVTGANSSVAKSAYALIGLPNLAKHVYAVWDSSDAKKKLDDAYKQRKSKLVEDIEDAATVMEGHSGAWTKPLGDYAVQRSTANRTMTGIMNILVLNLDPSKYKDVFTITPNGEAQIGGQTIPDATWEKGPGHVFESLNGEGKEKWMNVFSKAMSTGEWMKHREKAPMKRGVEIADEYKEKAQKLENDELMKILNTQSGIQDLRSIMNLQVSASNSAIWIKVLPQGGAEDIKRFVSNNLDEYLLKVSEYTGNPGKKDEVQARYENFFQGDLIADKVSLLAMFDILWSKWDKQDKEKRGSEWLAQNEDALRQMIADADATLQETLQELKGYREKGLIDEEKVNELRNPATFKAKAVELFTDDQGGDTIMNALKEGYKTRLTGLITLGKKKKEQQEQDQTKARRKMEQLGETTTKIVNNSGWTEVESCFASAGKPLVLPTKWIDTLIKEARQMAQKDLDPGRAEKLKRNTTDEEWILWEPKVNQWESYLVAAVSNLSQALDDNKTQIKGAADSLEEKIKSYVSNECLVQSETINDEAIKKTRDMLDAVTKDSGNYIVKDGRIESLVSKEDNALGIQSSINSTIDTSDQIWQHIISKYKYQDRGLSKKAVINFLDDRSIERSGPKQIQDALDKVFDNHFEYKALSKHRDYLNGGSTNRNRPILSLWSLEDYLSKYATLEVQAQENETLKKEINGLQSQYKKAFTAIQSKGTADAKAKQNILMVPYGSANSDKETFVQTVRNSVIVQEKELVEARKGYEDAWKEVARSYKAWKKYEDECTRLGVPSTLSEADFYKNPKDYENKLAAVKSAKADKEAEAQKETLINQLTVSLAELKNYNSTTGTEVQNLIAAADVTAKTTALDALAVALDHNLAGEPFSKKHRKLETQIELLTRCYKASKEETEQRLVGSVLEQLQNVSPQTTNDIKYVQQQNRMDAIDIWNKIDSVLTLKGNAMGAKVKGDADLTDLLSSIKGNYITMAALGTMKKDLESAVDNSYTQMWTTAPQKIFDQLTSSALNIDDHTAKNEYAKASDPVLLKDSVKDSLLGKVKMIHHVLESLSS